MVPPEALRQAMAEVEDGVVTLNEIVPFSWDSVYSFGPYTTQEQMEEIMGISARRLEESPSEGMVQLVFVNGGQIVCGICGYISKEGYSVSFDDQLCGQCCFQGKKRCRWDSLADRAA